MVWKRSPIDCAQHRTKGLRSLPAADTRTGNRGGNRPSGARRMYRRTHAFNSQ